MSLPAAQADEFIKRLRMFVLMSKVTLVDASGQWARLSRSGPDGDAISIGDLPHSLAASEE